MQHSVDGGEPVREAAQATAAHAVRSPTPSSTVSMTSRPSWCVAETLTARAPACLAAFDRASHTVK